MKTISELLFYLTAYPWFFMCSLLVLSLFVLRRGRGPRCQLVLERYLALKLLRDLDILSGISKPRYEPPALKVVALGSLDADRIWRHLNLLNEYTEIIRCSVELTDGINHRYFCDYTHRASDAIRSISSILACAAAGTQATTSARSGSSEPPVCSRSGMGVNPHAL